jgi:serpin B
MCGCRGPAAKAQVAPDDHSHPAHSSPYALPLAQASPAVAAANAFGFNLFHKLTAGKPDNVFISPTSLMLALAMTYNGAGGQTQAEMARVLQISGIPTRDLNKQLSTLQKALHEDDTQVHLEIANSLWANNGYSFKSPFAKLCNDSYDATLDSLDFSSPQALNTINGWASDKTHGLFPHIVTQQDLSQAALLLIDAVYFKGKWSNPFNQEYTHQAPFYLLGGKKKTVQMMTNSDAYIYTHGERLQAIALPYGDGRMAMIVVLPRGKRGLPALQESMTEKTWQTLLKRMRLAEGTIKLPRFEIDYEAYINHALEALGMRAAFTSGADFSAMADGIPGLAFVKHKSYLRVTEKKTQAAAASIGAPAAAGGPGMMGPFQMTVDHPFLLGIVDTQTGALVFLGGIVDPRETRPGE